MAITNSSFVISMFLLSTMVVVSAGAYGYGPKPNLEKPNTGKKLLTENIGVQGLIYCKSGPKLIPLKGAVARITCLAVDEYNYEAAPFSILSCPTDAKGFFFATVSSSELKYSSKLTECKAFLHKSPLESCKVSTNVNNGISGAILTSFKPLKNMKLYSVAPFVYTSEPKPVSKPY